MKCWKCGNEFTSPFCPVCGERAVSGSSRRASPRARKPAKVWYKKWWVWCIAAFILVGFFIPNEDKPEEIESGDLAAAPVSTKQPSKTPINRMMGDLEAEPSEEIAPDVEPSAEPTIEPTETPEATQEPKLGYVNAKSLNMRSEPNTESAIIEECKGKTPLQIVGEDGDWYKVLVGGAMGYMLKEYVGMGEPPKDTPRPTQEVTRNERAEEPIQTEEPKTVEIPYKQNYHGHVYATPSGERYHYEAECGGENSREITWDDVSRRNLGPCGTCVLK